MSKQQNSKLQKIDEQINSLKLKQEKIHHQLGEKIVKFLINKKAFEVDFNILYGAVIELTQKIKNADKNEIENWKNIAKDTLRIRSSARKISD
jgi:hypothetical protein